MAESLDSDSISRQAKNIPSLCSLLRVVGASVVNLYGEPLGRQEGIEAPPLPSEAPIGGMFNTCIS
jgi:hypothetical protein